MATGIVLNLPLSKQAIVRPLVASYGSGYEHSFDRYVAVKLMLQEVDDEANDVAATLALAS